MTTDTTETAQRSAARRPIGIFGSLYELVTLTLAMALVTSFATQAQADTPQVVSDRWVERKVQSQIVQFPVPAAKGTGVGNGGLRRQDQTVTNRRTGVEVQERWERWIDSADRSLRYEVYESRKEAYEAYIYGSPDQAFCSLQAALRTASVGMGNGPMTKALLDRGLSIAAQLNQGSERTDCSRPTNQATLVRKSRAAVLFDWIKMTIDVAENFDPKFYSPYRNLYNRCFPSPEACGGYQSRMPSRYHHFDYREFELGMIELAAKQVRLIQKFTLIGADGQVVPFGSIGSYLNLAMVISNSVVDDLIDNLYAHAYHRAVVELYNVALNLKRGYGHHFDAFNYTHRALANAVQWLDVKIEFPRCDSECSQENGWVTPDSEWVRPKGDQMVPPGMKYRTQDGWVSPR